MTNEQKFVQIKVRTEHLDSYPELFEAYKRSMGEAMVNLHGVEADWDTLTRHDGTDDVLVPDEDKPFSWLTVMGSVAS